MRKIVYGTDDIISEIRLVWYLFWISFEELNRRIDRCMAEQWKLIKIKERVNWTRWKTFYCFEYYHNWFLVSEYVEEPNTFLSKTSKRYVTNK